MNISEGKGGRSRLGRVHGAGEVGQEDAACCCCCYQVGKNLSCEGSR